MRYLPPQSGGVTARLENETVTAPCFGLLVVLNHTDILFVWHMNQGSSFPVDGPV